MKSEIKTEKVTLEKPHFHNGQLLKAGTEVELPGHVVKHIAANKKAKPAPAANPPAK